MANVTMLIKWRGDDEYTLDSREFESMPRVGEEIMVTQGVDMRKPAVNGIAFVRVTRVLHDLRVGYNTSVHAFVYVEPIDDALVVLEQLYPEEATDE